MHSGYRLFFHDTHHRSVSDPESMKKYDLTHYDGVLAFGEVIRQIYLANSWTKNAWTWHEAADVRIFRPLSCSEYDGEVIWIGNWGDEERSKELKEFLDPVEQLGLRGRIYGVRYPSDALKMLKSCGLSTPVGPQLSGTSDFLPYRFTVHIPRNPYVQMLPGIPTIRV